MTECMVNDCNDIAKHRGWCVAHYNRWLRHGDPLAGRPKRGGSLEEKFLNRINRLPDDGCWEWIGGMSDKGYGLLCLGPKRYARAHRWAYEHFVGPMPEGSVTDHLCRNRKCVRPDHLEAVTAGENALRGFAFSGINHRKTHCIRGHNLNDPENVYGYKGRRQCKECAREAARRQYQKKKG